MLDVRIFVASLATETNTFAPFPTGWSAFEENGIGRADELQGGQPSAMWAALSAMAQREGDLLIAGLTAFAQPSGRTVRRVYEALRDRLLDDLRSAGDVDVVLLLLHGAMVAEGYDDCEGDIIGRAREIAPQAVIGVELDPHCHLTAAMVEGADLIRIYKEYPHIDVVEQAERLYSQCRRVAFGDARPVAALVDTAMVGIYPTFSPPMSEIVSELRAAEARPGRLAANIAHGFPWGDVADVGTRVLVYADDDPDLAAREASALAERLYAQRDALLPGYPDLAAALDRALAAEGRVVLGDHADNPGGGAPGDSTFVLKAMLDRGLCDAALGCMHDPAVAMIAADAGEGAKLRVRLGGKSGVASGVPLDLDVEVLAVRSDHHQGESGTRMPVGLTVALRYEGVDLLVNTIRTQVYAPNFFTDCGIDLAEKRLIVVKSSSHFEAAFQPLADHLWRVATPGALQLDFAGFAYTLRDTRYHPRIPDPWAELGHPQPRLYPGRSRRTPPRPTPRAALPVSAAASASDPEGVVERQLRAYNAHDLDGFVASFSPDVEVLRLGAPPILLHSGRADLRRAYGALFERAAPVVRLLSRRRMGRFVCDHESARFKDAPPFEALAIYEVEDDVIRRLWLCDTRSGEASK
jgi:microcystin degradation protein MlrC